MVLYLINTYSFSDEDWIEEEQEFDYLRSVMKEDGKVSSFIQVLKLGGGRNSFHFYPRELIKLEGKKL